MSSGTADRSNNLDVIRFIAAAAVIYGHAFPLNTDSSPGLLSNSVQTIGVKIFFMLSGFLIAQSWDQDRSVWRFTARRALRLLPGLAVVLLLSALVIGPIFTTVPQGEYWGSPRFWSYLGNIGLNISYDLPGVWANLPYPGAINGSLWSLPVEVCMYVLTPAVISGAVLSRRPKLVMWLVTIGSVIASAVFVRTPSMQSPFVFYGIGLTSLIDVAPFFAVGALCYTCGWQKKISVQLAVLALLLAILFPARNGIIDELVLTMLIPILVLGFGFAPSPQFARAGRFGDISYGLYLYGWPAQQVVIAIHGKAMTPWINALISLVLATALALLSWHAVEKNALKLRPRGKNPPAPGESVTETPVAAVSSTSRRQVEAVLWLALLSFVLALPLLMFRDHRWSLFFRDNFQISLDVVLFALVVLVTPARFKRPLAWLTGSLYVFVFLFATYHWAFRHFFNRVPSIADDSPLLLNLVHYLQDLLHAGAWLAIAGGFAVLGLGAWGVARVLLTVDATAQLAPVRWRNALLIVLVSGTAIAAIRNGHRITFRAKVIFDNLITSRDRARAMKDEFARGPDLRYRPFEKATLAKKPNVYVMMLEAYGQRPAADRQMREPFRTLTQRMELRFAAAGLHSRTGYSEAPVFGGRSWLSISTVHTGVKIDQPGVYTVLEPVAAKIPSLTSYFHAQGYQTFAMQPGNRERSGLQDQDLFARDIALTGPDLGYHGTPYGWVQVPDQYALGFFSDRLATANQPFFAFSMSVSTHHPWLPVPYAADWKTLNTPSEVVSPPWEPIPGRDAIDEGFPRQYFDSVVYQWRCLAEFIERQATDDAIFILIGDHQPLIERTTADQVEDDVQAAADAQSYLSFIHVVSKDEAFVNRFGVYGLTAGLFAEPGAAPPLKHEGLYSLIVNEVVQRHGVPGAADSVQYYPNGLGLSALLLP